MIEIGIPRNKIFIITCVHFLLIVNALFTSHSPSYGRRSKDEAGIAPAYSFYNMFFILSLMWSIHSKESLEPVNTAYAVDFASMFFDIAILIFFSYGTWTRLFILLNMLFRVYSLTKIYEEVVRRGGDTENVGII